MRILGTLAGVVNLICMFAAEIVGDRQTFLIAWLGASFSGYAILHSLEERQDMGETRAGFRSLAMRLRWDIKEQGLAAGQKLPSIAELAARYQTTRTTVSRALRILAEEDLVEIVHGRGTYVVGGAREDRPKDRITWELLDQMKDRVPGDPFPSTAEIRRRHNVSHPTVRRVLKDLLARGVIRRSPNGGYEKV